MMPLSSACRGKILLVDDHGIVRHGIRGLLQLVAPEMQVDEASSVEGALSKVGAYDYLISMIDLDLSSPRSGLDLLERMRELNRGLPAIILSGHDDRDTILHCLQKGASGFISKSSEDDSVLRVAIELVLQGQVYLPSSTLGKGGSAPPFSIHAKSMPLESLNLKPKLKETLSYVYQGMSNKAIANKMNISEFTARDYCSDLYREFGVSRRAELIVELARRRISLADKDLRD